MATTKRRRRAGSLRGLTTASTTGKAAERLDNIKADALKVGLLTATGSVILAGLYFAKNAIEKGAVQRKEESASEKVAITSSPEFWADRLRTAFNPSGIAWMRDGDTTDVTGVMNVARGIKTQAQYVLIANAYRALTQRRLADDLNSELSAREYQEYTNILLKKPKK